ncbi:uncharacterized protein EI90DRAFT_3031227 [Cantharellus anzutake]|uniref:uncharacterized protein n=1 Tax=Cantharellus anzutake TaxID=1750568 RepID=UPI001902D745|nr:uncharacterized protein EI90DRAFT_3031227 [Cantharellus anzutake]KAF8343061.1 hypothetical protein EI90DRAFT_3031227 [Cantharellus anzutake]
MWRAKINFSLAPWRRSPYELLTEPRQLVTSTIAARLRMMLFFAIAVSTGIMLQFFLFGFPSSRTYGEPFTFKPEPPIFHESCGVSDVSKGYVRPGFGNAIFPYEDAWTLLRIKTMVSRTKGYLAHDYPLPLGWNDIRYIIESGMLAGLVLNRTLIIPSFLYARSCVFSHAVCELYAIQHHGSEDFGSPSGEKQQAWTIPIELMVDLPRLRAAHPVVTVAEYLHLHGLPISIERLNGRWDNESYLATKPHPVSFTSLKQNEYEPDGVVRVDYGITKPRDPYHNKPISSALDAGLGEAKTIDLDKVKLTLQEKQLAKWSSEEELERLLHANGWTFLYTFRGMTVTEPLTQVAKISQVRGLYNELASRYEEVLLLEGVIQQNIKPGFLMFGSDKTRKTFVWLVTQGVQPIAPVRLLAERLVHKLRSMNDGRQFMSADMRRGDPAISPPMDYTEARISRVKNRLRRGLKLVQELSHLPPQTANMTDIPSDENLKGAPPLETDKFFVLTDERSPEVLEQMRKEGAVTIQDLIREEDRRLLGWPMLFDDAVAQVEQLIASYSVFFYGHPTSSLAGDVVNLRAARGFDLRTSVFD